MIRRMVIAIEDWAMNDDSFLIGMAKLSLIIAVALVVVAFTVGGFHAWLFPDTTYDRCLASGRGWAIVGHHTEYAAKGGPYRVTDYGCVEVLR